MKKKLIVLVSLVIVAVVAYEAFDVSDAEAGKRKKPPPNYNMVFCPVGLCVGTPSADLLVSAAGTLQPRGEAGNDIYVVRSASEDANFFDNATSSDLYGGFLNGQFGGQAVADRGGIDRLDLSTNTSSYASTDFEFIKFDADGDGFQDDLHLNEVNFGADDNIYVLDHFGVGRVEYIKFSDKTLRAANIPLSQ